MFSPAMHSLTDLPKMCKSVITVLISFPYPIISAASPFLIIPLLMVPMATVPLPGTDNNFSIGI
nr:Biomphalaria glabrata elongation factor Tu; mitochondrial-like [Biomphalaria glabrata]